jgi:hypothetical protein
MREKEKRQNQPGEYFKKGAREPRERERCKDN